MGFLMVAACGIAGLYLGSVFGDAATAWLGAFGGLAIGLVLLRVRGLSTRIEGLRGELDALRHARPASAAPLPAAVATATPRGDGAGFLVDKRPEAPILGGRRRVPAGPRPRARVPLLLTIRNRSVRHPGRHSRDRSAVPTPRTLAAPRGPDGHNDRAHPPLEGARRRARLPEARDGGPGRRRHHPGARRPGRPPFALTADWPGHTRTGYNSLTLK